MSLSANIKRLRIERNMTQEQLGERLGVSAQAVSKWERSETYPDGALLVPLANELSISLDTLFDNEAVSMEDVSGKIISLLGKTESKERFTLVRDIGWQIERGLFNCRMQTEKKYDPCEIKKQKNSSYILDDTGFTVVSNGKEPFFSVFPEPEDGYGHFLENIDVLRDIFAALSHADTVKALTYLYRKPENYVFEDAVLQKDCDISAESMPDVLDDLLTLKIVCMQKLTVNESERTLFYSKPSHKLLALLILAGEICYTGAYSLQSHYRNTPFIKK